MSWNKNAFSCLIWLLYLFMVGTAMIFTGRLICDFLGMAACFGVIIPAGYLLVTGIIVFLLHRMAVKLDVGFRSMGKSLAWIENILILVLFAAGLFLRVIEVQPDLYAVPDESAYLKLAYISADGQGIPSFTHGAVSLYIWLLRLCFLLLGNKAVVAVWMQIALQMSGVMLLYSAVRKMAGWVPAAVTVSFFLLSPYMIRKSLEASPEMLYLLLFSLVLLFLSRGVECAFGWGFWLFAGAMTAVMSYLDVSGLLLLPLLPGIIVMRRQDAGRKIVRGLFGCLMGLLLGAAGCLSVDAWNNGKPVAEVIREWIRLYRWTDLRFSVAFSGFNTMWPVLLILCFMGWGIFSFWCGREGERFTVWIICLSMAILMQCMGVFTEEMSGISSIFFFSTVLAGLGIRESMTVSIQDAEEEKGTVEEKTETKGNAEVKGKTETKDKTETECNVESRNIAAEKASEKAAGGENTEEGEQPKRKIEFLENPLPLPKKHEKRVMDYKLDPDRELGGYDVLVADDDDYDH